MGLGISIAMTNNELDVSQAIRTTDPDAVCTEVSRIYSSLYNIPTPSALNTAFSDATQMYAGKFDGYLACDTAYHDIQHVLDVTLAMARLIDGYERSRIGIQPIGQSLFQLGVITALFHDVGYLRRQEESAIENGAEFTLTHVSRGATFLRQYLPRIGMPEFSETAAALVHFTGYEQHVSVIKVPGLIYRLLGNLLGSADIIAQMADRCYLEKCRDRLYPEFVVGGLAKSLGTDGIERSIFESGDDLVRKTPSFYIGAQKRLNEDLEKGFNYAEAHFRGQNLYLDELNKNIDFAKELAHEPDLSALRRTPPDTLVDLSANQ
jgi:hypothetical protein